MTVRGRTRRRRCRAGRRAVQVAVHDVVAERDRLRDELARHARREAGVASVLRDGVELEIKRGCRELESAAAIAIDRALLTCRSMIVCVPGYVTRLGFQVMDVAVSSRRSTMMSRSRGESLPAIMRAPSARALELDEAM
jgi:hypothetical protein